MGKDTHIQWTQHTWNWVIGCRKVDADCLNCYFYRDSSRYGFDPREIRKSKTKFNLPDTITEPSLIFTPSWSDPFLEEIDSFRHDFFEVIRRNSHHTYQVLTKRPERITDCIAKSAHTWTQIYKSVWMGTSVGSQASIQRLRDLIKASLITPFKITFLSAEPLWGPLDLTDFYYKISEVEDRQTRMIELLKWVIVGGESGNETGKYRYRPCKLEWIESLVEQCKQYNVPVFVKQLGTHLSKELGLKDRHGGDINEWPEHLRIREFPKF